MAIKRSVDVIRAAAAEQKGFADQVIDPPKLKARFLEAAADLDRAADRMEALERRVELLEWLKANVGNVDFHVNAPAGVLCTNPWIAVGSNFEEAVTKAKDEMAAATAKG